MATMKQRVITKVFTFYLDAWLYAHKHNLKNYKIKKTGAVEMTLIYPEPVAKVKNTTKE